MPYTFTSAFRASLATVAILAVFGARVNVMAAEQPPGDRASYRLADTVFLGDPPDWDYVYFEPTAHEVFVAHGNEVTVVDGHTGAIRGRVTGLSGAHGLAALADLGKGYVVSRQQHSVAVFDLKSLRVIKRVPVDTAPDSLAYEPVTRRIVVMDAEAPTATVIDTANDTVVATVQLQSTAEQLTADGTGKVFINLAERRAVARLDARTARIEKVWPVPACESPHGIALDSVSHRLFVSCLNSLLLVLETTNGRAIARLPIGKGTDGVGFDAKRNRVFSSNGWDGNLSVIGEQGSDKYASLGEVPTARFGRTLALDVESGRIYVAAADLDRIDPTLPKWSQYVMRPGSLRLLFLDPVH